MVPSPLLKTVVLIFKVQLLFPHWTSIVCLNFSFAWPFVRQIFPFNASLSGVELCCTWSKKQASLVTTVNFSLSFRIDCEGVCSRCTVCKARLALL